MERREYIKKAEELESQGKIDEAIEVLKECREVYPEFLVGRLFLARLLYSKGNITEAFSEADFIIQRTPDSLGALNLLAQIYMDRGELLKAKDTLLKIKFLSPFNEEVNEKIQLVEEKILESVGEQTVREKVPFEIEESSEELDVKLTEEEFFVEEFPEEQIPVPGDEVKSGQEPEEKSSFIEEELQEEELSKEDLMASTLKGEQEVLLLEEEEFPEGKVPGDSELGDVKKHEEREKKEEIFYTDTMAQVLLKQGEVDKAEEIYLQLYQKHPKKYGRKLTLLRQMKALIELQKKIEVIKNGIRK